MLQKCVAFCVLSLGAVAFGQSQQTDPAILEKIKKYMSLAMYEEAGAAVQGAIKQNEFDPSLRSIYGDVLVHQQRYNDALNQFELWSRLDTVSWQALQRAAITAEMIKTTSIMNLRDDDPAKFAAWLKPIIHGKPWRSLLKKTPTLKILNC